MELYERLQPELLIIDIKMPGMDGLELCRHILSRNIPVKILLLTAYKDFEYAKKAITMGISNYILKHELDEDILLSELQKVRSDLENDSKRLQIIRSQVFARALKGDCKCGELGDDCKHICDPFGNFALLVFQLDKPFPILEVAVPSEKLPFDRVLERCRSEITDFVNYMQFVEMEENYTVLIVSMKKVCSQKVIKENLYILASNFQKQLKQSSGKTASIVITNTSAGVEGLALLYKKAVKTLQKSIFYGREKVFLHEEPEDFRIGDSGVLNELWKSLEEAMDGINLSILLSSINRIFHIIVESKNILLLSNVCRELVARLDVLLRSKTIMTFESIIHRDPDCSGYWYSVNDICKWFKSIVTDIMNEIENAKHGSVSNKTRQVIQYIEKHYGEDLTVEKLAETLRISRVYLGQLFKKETGLTFLEYLTQYRINAAKRMLSGGNYKIYEVAEKTGYKTSQYFSEVFRKITGMNPLDYRDGVRDCENEY